MNAAHETTPAAGHPARALTLFPGQRFQGRGNQAGLSITVLGYEPETETHCGMARVRIESLSHEALQHLRNQAASNPHEPSRRSAEEQLARLSQPHEEARELEWFKQWLARGLIEEVRS